MARFARLWSAGIGSDRVARGSGRWCLPETGWKAGACPPYRNSIPRKPCACQEVGERLNKSLTGDHSRAYGNRGNLYLLRRGLGCTTGWVAWAFHDPRRNRFGPVGLHRATGMERRRGADRWNGASGRSIHTTGSRTRRLVVVVAFRSIFPEDGTMQPCNAATGPMQPEEGISDANSACVPEAERPAPPSSCSTFRSRPSLWIAGPLGWPSWCTSPRLSEGSSVGCCWRTTPRRGDDAEDKNDATEATGANRKKR